MMMKHGLLLSLLPTTVSLLLILAQGIETTALVVPTPRTPPFEPFVDVKPREPPKNVTPSLLLRIRSTKEGDLNDVSSLLAIADMNIDESQWNWKTKMEVLRNKSRFHKLLSSRYQAMKEGERAVQRVPIDHTLNRRDRLHLLWAQDSFRKKLERAATMAEEPHVWKAEHSFTITPRDPNSLRHAMITAEDVMTDTIVGFCEIAMLARLPSRHQYERFSTSCAPTIANLAASPKYRRQGVASSLLKSVTQYVQSQWSGEDIALYVDSANKSAISLYAKHGFFPLQSVGDSGDGGQLYMTKALQPITKQEPVRA